jgi:hypothetical protein
VDLDRRPSSQDLKYNARLVHAALDKNIHFHQDDGLCLLEHEHAQGRRSNAIAVKMLAGFTRNRQGFALRKWMRSFKNCSNVM